MKKRTGNVDFDCPDFAPLIGTEHGEIYAMQKLMDRLKAIEEKVEKIQKHLDDIPFDCDWRDA